MLMNNMAIFDQYKQAVQDVVDGNVKEPPRPSVFPDEQDMLAALYAAAAALSLSKEAIYDVSSLPSVSATDNGKVLMVVDGAWSAATIPNASGVSF